MLRFRRDPLDPTTNLRGRLGDRIRALSKLRASPDRAPEAATLVADAIDLVRELQAVMATAALPASLVADLESVAKRLRTPDRYGGVEMLLAEADVALHSIVRELHAGRTPEE